MHSFLRMHLNIPANWQSFVCHTVPHLKLKCKPGGACCLESVLGSLFLPVDIVDHLCPHLALLSITMSCLRFLAALTRLSEAICAIDGILHTKCLSCWRWLHTKASSFQLTHTLYSSAARARMKLSNPSGSSGQAPPIDGCSCALSLIIRDRGLAQTLD